MNEAALFSSLKDLEYFLLAGAFALARMAGMMAIMPLFSRLRLTGILRNGVALAFAVPILPVLVEMMRTTEMSTTLIIGYMLKELIVGVTLGIVLGIPFWAAEAAGDIIDMQRGSTMGALIDPMMTHETSATGTFLSIIMIGIYLAAGGLELTLDAVFASYNFWPVDQLLPVFNREAAFGLLDLLTRILSMALVLGFPLIVGLLISDIVMAFLARGAPSLNVFALSLVVKTGAYSAIFVLYAAFLVNYMGDSLGFLRDSSRLFTLLSCRDC